MRSRRSGALALVVLCLLALACRLPVQGQPTPVPAATATPPAGTATPLTPTAVAAPTRQPTFTVTPPSSPTPAPTASLTPMSPSDPHLSPEHILIFPWPLHEGDHLSVDVDPELAGQVSEAQLAETVVTLAFDGWGPVTTTVTMQGMDGAPQARFYWTTQLTETLVQSAGAEGSSVTLSLTVTLHLPAGVDDPVPGNNTVVLPVEVQPREALPPPEHAPAKQSLLAEQAAPAPLGAQWVMTETAGFRLHYVAGGAADRDVILLLDAARSAYVSVTARLGEADDPVDIYLLDRVIGQGGYASAQWVAVTYTDRRYAPVQLGSVLRHELVHRLDDAIGCDAAPPLVREGLAVYLAGGHYRPEPLRQKARALLATSHDIPFHVLVEDFYTHQHEVAYLKSGSLIAYIVDMHGWEAVVAACRATAGVEGGSVARWDAFLASVDGGVTTLTLEQNWRAWLRATPEDSAAYDPVLLDLELRLMEAMRAYQARYDPAAHFLRGILFSPEEGARRGIVADFVRRPRDPVSIGFELVLVMGQEAVENCDALLLALLIEDLELGLTQGPDSTVFVRDAIEIAAVALGQDWEPGRLLLMLDTYSVTVAPEGLSRHYMVYATDRSMWPQPATLTALQTDGGWVVNEMPDVP